MQASEYARLDKLFRRGKSLMKMGILAYALIFVMFVYLHHKYPGSGWFCQNIPYFKEHKWFAFAFWMSITLFIRPLSIGYMLLYEIFKNFVKDSKIQEAATALRHTSNGKSVLYPKFRFFLYCKSLKEFESRSVKYYEARRRQYLKLKHLNQEKAKAMSRIEKIEGEQENLERQFVEASVFLSDGELAKFEKRFRESKTIVAAQSVVREIQAKAKEKEETEGRQNAKIDSLLQALLADASQNGLCSKAEILVVEIKKSPYAKQKIEYLKHAISAQRDFNKKVEQSKQAIEAS